MSINNDFKHIFKNSQVILPPLLSISFFFWDISHITFWHFSVIIIIIATDETMIKVLKIYWEDNEWNKASDINAHPPFNKHFNLNSKRNLPQTLTPPTTQIILDQRLRETLDKQYISVKNWYLILTIIMSNQN